jgi:hypothetical protein
VLDPVGASIFSPNIVNASNRKKKKQKKIRKNLTTPTKKITDASGKLTVCYGKSQHNV